MKNPKTTTSTSRRNAAGRIVLAAFVLCATAAAWFIWRSASIPEDSPFARMYRTEADIAALVRALDQYLADEGLYPPSGVEGLNLAAKALSRNVDFLPEGPPRDAWGRQFHYENSGTGDYTLHSKGFDQDSGIDDISDDPRRTWRDNYRERQRHYIPGSDPSEN